MALLHVIRREKLKALSTGAVLCLVTIMGLWGILLLLITGGALYQAGQWVFIPIVCTYLGKGLVLGWIENVHYCRPEWFKAKRQWS
jgi:hypothetical protein